MKTYGVVLAAGKGTRMKSDLAKVLHQAAGRPLVLWMLDLLDELDLDQTIVVVGHQADDVRRVLPAGITTALQAEQLGTGHAVMVALDGMALDPGDRILVVPGDMPLISTASLRRLMEQHESREAAASLLSVVIDDPPPYGRIIRNDEGDVVTIVEARDATPEQLAVTELNTSVYVFDGAALQSAVAELSPENAQGELYLTDVIEILHGRGRTIAALTADDPAEGQGVNTVAELEMVGEVLAERYPAEPSAGRGTAAD